MRNIDLTNGCSSLLSRTGKKLLTTTAMTAVGLLSLTGNAKAANDWSDHAHDAANSSAGSSVSITVDAPNSATNINAIGSVVKVQGDADLKAGWTANINQDNASAKYIVFDVENGRSQINGDINANGEIFIFDRDGVVFGAASEVNVGSIVASSGQLMSTNEQLDAGVVNINLENTDGDVRNNGNITVAQAGLAAFVAPNVSNSGVINAKMATVAMGAGETVTLDMYGDGLVEIAVDGELADGLIRNTGNITANGGNVLVSAAIAKDAVADVINMAGVTTVSSAQVQGGKIILSGGSSGRVNVRGALNANGVGGQDAGTVDVRGERVRVASTGRLRANAQPDGEAGEINVIADKTMIIDGRLSAQGLAGTGDIETSAPIALFGAGASILANREWILDPTDVDINAGSVLEGLIEGQLAAGDMTVATPAGGTDAGSIALRTVIDWFTANTFKLVAHNDIFLSGAGGGINAAGGGDFIAEAGDDFRMNAGNSSIIMNGGSVDITAADEFTLDDGFILAGGGDITIDNAESFQAAANSLRTSGTGSITINQNKDVNGNTTTTDATIQNAVNAILNTGTGTSRINLGAGTWAESTTIDRAVSIVGDNQATTFITPGAGNDGFTIDGTIDGNVALLKMNISGGRDGVHVNDTADVKGLVINKVDFEDNALRGVAVFGDSVDATVIKNSNFLNNGIGSTSAGDGDILFFLYNGNVNIQNVDIQNNSPSNTADYGIQIRGSDTFAQSGKLKFTNLTVSGDYRAAQLGIQRFTNLRSLDMTNVELGGQTDAGTDSAGWGSLYFSNIGTGDFSIGNTSFDGAPSPLFQHIINDSEVNFDATDAAFEGVAAADLTTEQSFGVEDKVFHKMDLATRGLVTWQDGNVFVTQASNDFSGGGGIQRGVDASDVGGNVWVDDGTFAESVNVNKTVNLFGNNHGLDGTDAARGPESLVTPNSPGFLVTADDVTIDGFAIDGADNGVEVDNADRVTVENNVITNSTENGIYVTDSADAAVTGNAITTTTDEGVFIEDSDNYTVASNTITDTGENGIRVFSSDDGFIQGNDVSDTGHNGIAVIRSDNATINMSNIIDDTFSAGVALNRTTNSLVDDNDISNTGGSGIWINRANGSTVSNNDIDTTWVGASRATGSGVHVVDTANSEVTGNDIANAGIDGVHVEGATTILIDDNDIDNATNGIRVTSGSGVTISDNEIDDASDAAIHITNIDDAQIISNEVNDNGASTFADYGIRVEGGDSVDVKENKIEETSIAGIEATDTTSIVIDDNLIKDGEDGIVVSGGSDADILDNEIRDMNDDGIDVSSNNDVEIKDGNVILRSGGAAIAVAGSKRALIDDNNIDVAKNGIRVRNSKKAKVTNNEIDDASKHAVFVKNSNKAEIIGNDVNDNGASTFVDYGILVDGGEDVYIFDNKIEETNIAGIQATDTVSIDVEDNLVKDGNNDGIVVDGGSDAEIFDNEILRMDGDGIDVSENNFAEVFDNEVEEVGDNGIQVSQSRKAFIFDNDVTDAGNDGINVKRSNKSEIFGNTVTDITEDGIDVERSKAVQIIDNIVGLIGDDAIEVTRSNFANIRRNLVGLAGDDGIDINKSDDVEIINNLILATRDDGISIDDSEDTNIRRNIIGLIGDDGIDVNDSEGTDIINNTIGFVRENGVQLTDSDDVRIKRNNIQFVGENGIQSDGGSDIRIRNNEISSIAEDGINVNGNDRVRIIDNEVNNTGGEGIQVKNAYKKSGTAVIIAENDVQFTEGDGIKVKGFSNALIEDNRVRDTDGTGIKVKDGGSVEIFDNILRRNDTHGIKAKEVSEVDIRRNFVRKSYKDGIIVDGFGFAEVINNDIARTGDDGIEAKNGRELRIARNDINKAGGNKDGIGSLDADGIHVENISGMTRDRFNVRIVNNNITNSADDGIEALSVHRILAARNTVDTSGDDGIRIVNDLTPKVRALSASIYDPRPSLAVARGNVVTNSGTPFPDPSSTTRLIREPGGDGIEIGGFERIRVRENDVSTSVENGLNISGGNNGEVEVSGNTFTDNDTGALFQSGNIDLTGDRNFFNGGRVGMKFSPAEIFPTTFGFQAIQAVPIEPTFASLSLVDNTIGAQTFDGQSELYVELENGALFDPGTPTLLNALDSTYIGTPFGDVTPSVDFPAGFSVAQVAFFESMFEHFNDNGNTGLFFFPLLPEIDQEDILRFFGPNASSLSGLNLTILGLPGIPGGTPVALNNIAPAAGGDTSPEALNAIATAAGGEDGGNTSGCYGDALNTAQGGQTATVSYGGSAEDLLNSEASCGS